MRIKTNNSKATQSPKSDLEKQLARLYEFRYNDVTGKLEIKHKNKPGIKPVSDYIINSIYRSCINNGINISKTKLVSVLYSDFSPRYNPLREYLSKLPDWDGETDFIEALAHTVSTTNDDLWLKCFKKWFVAMVASVMHDEIINHTVLIITGAQGKGKSTWQRRLLPKHLANYSHSGMIFPGDKDSRILMAECMLIILEELETLKKSDVGAIKDMVTMDKIKIRRPYGFSHEDLPRIASFAGSVNDSQFLSDVTGNRRFLCFEATNIDYSEHISLDTAYSQAKALFNAGFQYWFNSEEIAELAVNNEDYRLVPAEEDLLLANFVPCTRDEADLCLPAAEILNRLQDTVQGLRLENGALNRLGKALNASQFVKFKRGGQQLYALKQKVQAGEIIDSAMSSFRSVLKVSK